MPTSKEKEKESTGNSTEWNPEKVAAAYKQAINDYETYYQQQESDYHESFQYKPYSHYSSPGYIESSCREQLANEYESVLAEYEESLQTLEMAMTEFNAAFKQIICLEGKEQEECFSQCKDYLNGHLEMGNQLVCSIQDELKALSQ